jgi:aminoglycoside 6'-N-acetyltransferase I
MIITYRQAHIADLNVVTDLLCKLYTGHHTDGEILAENRDLLTNPTQAIFLAYDGAAPVGVVHAAVRREYVEGAHDDVCGYLEAVYTEPEYRLRGIAKSLVAEYEKWARSQGCTVLASDCELDNTGSLSFHLRLGFCEVSRNIHFVRPLNRESPLYSID